MTPQLAIFLGVFKTLEEQNSCRSLSNVLLCYSLLKPSKFTGFLLTLGKKAQETIGDVRVHFISSDGKYGIHGPDEPFVVRSICAKNIKEKSMGEIQQHSISCPHPCKFNAGCSRS